MRAVGLHQPPNPHDRLIRSRRVRRVRTRHARPAPAVVAHGLSLPQLGPVHVVVAGAGLSGLALATGLARAGHEVVVLEADASLDARRQGYRLHLDSRGLTPLRTLLPAAAYDAVVRTRGVFVEPRRLEVRTGRLRHLRTVATSSGFVDGQIVSTAVDRGTLRAILSAAARSCGVDVRWDCPVTSYDAGPSGVLVRAGEDATAHLEADLLVGCDGTRSRVAAQLLGHPGAEDSGARLVVGRSPLQALSPQLGELLDHGYVVLRGVRSGCGLGLMRFAERPEDVGREAGMALAPVADYVMWNVDVGRRSPLRQLPSEGLHVLALDRLRHWDPQIRALVAAADPEATFAAPIRISPGPEPWQPSRVTVLGDAIHAMPPDRGSGANLALADAARLCAAIAEVSEGESARPIGAEPHPLLSAIARSEREMLLTAFSTASQGPTADRRA